MTETGLAGRRVHVGPAAPLGAADAGNNNPQISLPLPLPLYPRLKTTMASRITRSIPRALKAHAAPLSTSAPSPASAKLVARNALLTTAAPKVPRSASRFLVGEGQKRAASSDEGVTMMVRRVCYRRQPLAVCSACKSRWTRGVHSFDGVLVKVSQC